MSGNIPSWLKYTPFIALLRTPIPYFLMVTHLTFFFLLNSCPSIWLYAFTTLTTLNQCGMILVYDVWNIHIEFSTICEIFTLNESHKRIHSAVKALLSSMPIAFSYTCLIITLVYVCNFELFIASLILLLYFKSQCISRVIAWALLLRHCHVGLHILSILNLSLHL